MKLSPLIVALLACSSALATTPAPQPSSPPTSSVSDADAAAAAAARAAAQAAAIAAQQQAMLANLRATGGAGGAGGSGTGTGTGSGVGAVDVAVAGDSSDYNSRAYALGLPALVAAPAVSSGSCMRHSRGIGAFSGGVTGGTFFDKDCLAETARVAARQDCFAMADRLALWGRPDAAVQQLTSCGAIAVQPLPDAPTSSDAADRVDLSGYVSRSEFEQRLAEEALKRQRQFDRSVGK